MSSKFAPKVYESFLLGYDSNSCAYRVFNKDSGCIETTCDAVFDETNGSQVGQYDLDIVYESFLLGYDSNSCAYRVFNKDSGCIETTCDVVFDETNGSQVRSI
jgi:hypothetical protein